MKLPVFLSVLLVLAACHDSSNSVGDPASGGGDNGAGGGNEPPVAVRGAVPSGAPPAAFGTEPELPANPAWPFAEGAPRTMGTGRYAHGAYYWTDFVYDASGAKGPNVPLYRIGTPSGGSMTYPDDIMAGNGADIFIVGIGEDPSNTYWRVDWQTMLDTTVPVAAFGVDFKEGGFDSWPGIPNLGAPGLDAVIYLSSNGAFVDFNDGNGRQRVGVLNADPASRSFVASIPKTVLDPDAAPQWRVYLASGINDGEGGFLNDNQGFRSLPHQPPVFNMAFRDYQDEPASSNFWFDEEQSIALNEGDASAFFVDIDWARMGETEPEDIRIGKYSNRWYVSSLAGTDLGDGSFEAGIDRSENPNTQPQYYDRVQPYGLYIPSSYDPDSETLFTWMLHSLTQNHNQYSATVPNFLDGGCERLRQSICATTLGRGPAGFYQGAAEVDFWEVWRDVAAHFNIDPDRTISSGYSMGAIGTIDLMIKYPEVFAGGVVLAGSNDTLDLMRNLKWNGYYHAHGTFDELVPFLDARATVDAMKNNGYRYRFDHYFAEDHIIWTLKDAVYSAYEEAVKWMVDWLDETGTRKSNPGNFVYRWDPNAIDEARGIGPRGAWWVSDILADDDISFAHIAVDSEAISEALVSPTELDTQFIEPNDQTFSPALREEQVWLVDGQEDEGGLVSVELENVASLTLDLARAGIADRDDKAMTVSAADSATLVLTGLADGTVVTGPLGSATVSGGVVSIEVDAGQEQAIAFSDP